MPRFDSIEVSLRVGDKDHFIGDGDLMFRRDVEGNLEYRKNFPNVGGNAGRTITREDWVKAVQALQQSINDIIADQGIADLVAAAD